MKSCRSAAKSLLAEEAKHTKKKIKIGGERNYPAQKLDGGIMAKGSKATLSEIGLTMRHVNLVCAKLADLMFSDGDELEILDATLICDHVALLEVLNFLEKHEPLGIRIRFEPENSQDVEKHAGDIMGKFMAVELPTNAHEAAAAEISYQITKSVEAIINEQTLQLRSSPIFQIGSILKQPDSSLGPMGLETEEMAREATTVVEIGYRHETLAMLKRSMSAWVASESPIVSAVGIKISEERNGTRKMLALLYKKGAISNPVQEIEFGTDAPYVPGLVLNVSLRDLFFGAHEIQGDELKAALDHDYQIEINLAKLQKIILKVPCHVYMHFHSNVRID
jgi:hypothetical protein